MPLKMHPTEAPWYGEGLRFKCTECGKCCTGEPGYVWLTPEDIKRFCTHLKMDRADFLKKYTRRVGSRISLIEKPTNFDCIFLEDNKCTAYEARPNQCRTFPWWKSTLANRYAWESSKSFCEGIDHPDGELFTPEEITELKK